ncbi:hypothetical protein DFH09DRAFT_1204344 [Mycena vulgaris]|nr:hypothetical protein DFH09DRAFT_1204344 [Mycena vulgaris]
MRARGAFLVERVEPTASSLTVYTLVPVLHIQRGAHHPRPTRPPTPPRLRSTGTPRLVAGDRARHQVCGRRARPQPRHAGCAGSRSRRSITLRTGPKNLPVSKPRLGERLSGGQWEYGVMCFPLPPPSHETRAWRPVTMPLLPSPEHPAWCVARRCPLFPSCTVPHAFVRTRPPSHLPRPCLLPFPHLSFQGHAWRKQPQPMLHSH